jgi:26S proteasome regulatory subunit N10
LGQVLGALHKITSALGGQTDIITAISIAQLALKHRTNKNLRQRIVVFVGSPLSQGADEKNLAKLAKKLKKNNVAVDVVSFGEDESRNANETPLRAFVEGANSGDNSHFLTVPPGSRLLSDAIVSSAILAGEGAAADVMEAANEGGPSGAAGGEGFEFGVDPNLDPELALVSLKLSI